MLIVGADATVWVAEGKLLERHGFHASAVAGRPMSEILPPGARAGLTQQFQATLSYGPRSFDYRTADGQSLCWIHLTPLYFGEDEPVAVLSVIQDVTERTALTAELQIERARRERAEEAAGFGHWEIDPENETVVLSDGAIRLLGRGALRRLPVRDLLGYVEEHDRQRVATAIAAIRHTQSHEWECELRSGDGTVRRMLMRGSLARDGSGRELIAGTLIDISRLRAAEEAQLESENLFKQGFDRSPIGMALTDPVDGRYLRVNDALCELLGRNREELLAMSFIDVSHPDDMAAARTGWSEMQRAEASELKYEKRYLRPDGSLVWASLNVMPVFDHRQKIRAFLSQVVDMTARKAREAQLLEEAADFERLAEIRAALAEDRLVLHAQPIVDAVSGEFVQQELLVRLRRDNGQIIMPNDFLPTAERHGVITEIDRWVVRRAIKLAAEGAPVEVNLSGASVGDHRFLTMVREELDAADADPALLVFEVTETALMADLERGRQFAHDLRALGCKFALDDFGTGYGTFTYLKHIPIDYLKIDVDFVRDLSRSDDDERLVRAIVTMAHELGKKTTAEGVEDAETLKRLCELGVDYAQGYFIGRPGELHCPAQRG